ncbi:helix-turn-helix transcriptional regulator [Paenibacillus ginsengihumi]|uniref:helix-turn-helix transcriptional regulator n=1 Tax=Paenibacillus ginsengihumi TaxID=431596 RepID=UPI000594B8DB|nr:AraC family transcriptional regulator [Paenibacillus ginsengihumi]
MVGTGSTHLSFLSPPLPYYVECGQATYMPGEQHPDRKQIGFFDLILVDCGKLYIGENGRQWEVSPGQALILRPDGSHYAVQACEATTRFYWLHFQAAGEWEEVEARPASLPVQARERRAAPYRIVLPKYASLPSPELACDLIRRLMELSTVLRSVAFWEEQQLFADLLKWVEDAERDSPAQRLAERTEAYIKRHFQSDLSNRKLAEALHFHPNYITRCMQEVYRCTPMEYLHQYRLDQAKLLLIKTEWPIARIAEHVGFHHTPYFSSCFRKKEGLSPLQFRKQYAK